MRSLLPSLVVVVCAGLLACSQEQQKDSASPADQLYDQAMAKIMTAHKTVYDEAMTLYSDASLELIGIQVKYPDSMAARLAVMYSKYQQKVPSSSMEPTFWQGVDVRIFRFGDDFKPMRGDIVQYVLPNDKNKFEIQRIVGMPGDRIQMVGGVLHVNGEAVKQEPMEDFRRTYPENIKTAGKRWRETLSNGAKYEIIAVTDAGPYDDTPVYEVPADCYFLMGDNRKASTDSRDMAKVGFVPAANVVGRATYFQ